MRLCLVVPALLGLPLAAGRVGRWNREGRRRSLAGQPLRGDSDATYPVKARRAYEATAHWTMSEIRDKYHLTFDEDSPPKSLEPFLLQLFTTDGNLPEDPSLATVMTGLETFLTDELNAVFAPTHAVHETQASVVEQRAITNGTALLTHLEVTFKFEPSPEQDIVEFWVKSIMADLAWLISNITSIAHGDPELAHLTSAHRGVYVESEWPGIKDDNADTSSPTTSEGSNWISMPYVIVPTVLAGAILVGLVVLLAVHRNEQRRAQLMCFAAPERPSLLLARANLQNHESNGKANESIDTNQSAYIEEGSGLYSYETGVMDLKTTDGKTRPVAEISPKHDAIEKSYSDSDIFSGIESTVTSPCGATSNASIFSFFSGLTEPVSNRATNRVLKRNKTGDKSPGGSYVLGISSLLDTDAQDAQGTPHSKKSSLFAFNEEGDEEDADEDSDILPKASLCSPTLPYDEAEDPDVAEDFLIDTASMNSETLQQQMKDQSNDDDNSHQGDTAGTGAVWSGTSSPLSASGQSPSSIAKSVENRSIGEINTASGSPTKKSWLQRLTPRTGKNDKKPKRSTSPRSTEVNLDWGNVQNAQNNAVVAAAFVEVVRSYTAESPTNEQQTRGRRHAKSTNPDGTQEYQRETMAPNPDWSLDEGTTESRDAGSPAPVLARSKNNPDHENQQLIASCTDSAKEESHVSGLSSVQYLSSSVTNSSSLNTTESQPFDMHQSPSQQLYSDLVWLEQKVRRKTFQAIKDRLSPNASDVTGPKLCDSLSTASEPGISQSTTTDTSISAQEGVRASSTSSTRSQDPPRQPIVCRDCTAPPGKLKIIIHSTKDGPAVHTVKEGSALAGKLFPGDLIISVDNVDTRSYSAEQVMKMMTAKSKFERKITVLHFEE